MSKNKTAKHTKQKTYYTKGMHCPACETLIKNDIAKHTGVTDVSASLHNGKVIITAKTETDIPNIEDLNNTFKEEGYEFFKTKEERSSKNFKDNDIAIAIIIVALVISLFLIAEKTGFFIRFSLSSASSYPAYFIFGLAAGVSSCAALVGGLLLSMSGKWNEAYGNNKKKKYIPFILFNAGRLFSFALLGGILGLIGATIGISITVTAYLTIIVSFIMVILGLQMIGFSWAKRMSVKTPGFVNKYIKDDSELTGKYVPFLVGGLTFFVPCGFTLIAQSNALLTGSFIQSALLMTAFALGTLPMLALISFTSAKLYTNKRFSRAFSITAGTLVVFFGLYTMNSQLNVLGFLSLSDFGSQSNTPLEEAGTTGSKIVGDTQTLKTTASGFAYSPSMTTIKAGIPTTWVIDNKGAQGCASAMYARGLYEKAVFLKPGINTVDIGTPQAGTYKISCSMGMVPPITVKVI